MLTLMSSRVTKGATAIYARLSRNPNGESTSITRQIEACKKRLGAGEPVVFEDDDTSAYSGKVRPAWETMLAQIEQGTISTVVAYALDRLARRPKDIERLLETGVRLITVRDGLDSNTASSELFIRILSAVAKMESDTIAARILNKHAELRENGKWSGGRRAFGLNDDWSAVVPSEAKLIREAAEATIKGASTSSIVAKWNKDGIRTRSGARWDLSSMKRMLLSPRMVGRRWVGSELSAVGTPPILDEEVWQSVRVKLTDPERANHKPTATVKHLLAGMLRCGNCGARMHSRWESPTRIRYACSARRGGCGSVSIQAGAAETTVLDRLSEWTHSSEYLRRITSRIDEESKNDEERSAIETSLRADRDKRNSLIDLWTAGELSQDEWKRARATLDERIAEQEAKLDRIGRTSSEVLTVTVPLVGDMESELFHVQRAQLMASVDKIIVHKARGRGRRFDPRIDVQWR
jgi:site-specific DNA recombinase